MVFGIFKKIFGKENAAGRDKELSGIRCATRTGEAGTGSERRNRFEDFERETRERLEAQSHEMPGQAYFSQLQALHESISDRRYPDAAIAARKSLPIIRKWLEDPRGNRKRLSLNMPALTQGGTMLAITGDRKGLAMLHDLVSEFDHLEEYRADAEMSAKDASAVYTEPPRPGSHQARSKLGKPIELNLDKLTLVPLPPSPEAWASQVTLPATSETFEDAEGAWRELTVEAIAPADRPDPAFRKHFTTRGGVLSFDDLAKSEASLGAPGAVMFTSEQGVTPIIERLERPIYALDVHPEGQGFATRSKANILTVYDADLKVDFETDLSATPEVAAGRRRLDLGGEGGILSGEPHLALNCIAITLGELAIVVCVPIRIVFTCVGHEASSNARPHRPLLGKATGIVSA